MKSKNKKLKVAVVQDWLVDMGGAEKVLKAILSLYPDAQLFSLVATQDAKKKIGVSSVVESFICRLPFGRTKYRNYLQLFPLAIEGFDLSSYDLIISSSSSVAKGVLTNSNQLHICYCHTPARYVWDLTWQYMREKHLTSRWSPISLYVRRVLHKFRIWDVISSKRVDHFVANSNYISRRINKVYGRQSDVIYPPVNIERFVPATNGKREDFYITASRMVPYKKISTIVEAFANMPDKQLIVIGSGPEEKNIKKLAKPNIHFVGYAPTDELISYMQRAKAFVFAAEEDFGIVPVEAQSCGTPVIAYGYGGALETVADGETGLFFYEQTPDAIKDAVLQFEARGANDTFTPENCRQHALQFSEERFKKEFKSFIDSKLAEFYESFA